MPVYKCPSCLRLHENESQSADQFLSCDTCRDPWNFKDWLSMVNHLTLPEIRCDVPPSAEILQMMDSVGLDAWESHANRLERHIVKDRWVWPETDNEGNSL